MLLWRLAECPIPGLGKYSSRSHEGKLIRRTQTASRLIMSSASLVVVSLQETKIGVKSLQEKVSGACFERPAGA